MVHCQPPLPGRYVRVQMFGKGILTLCEVLVFTRMGKLLNIISVCCCYHKKCSVCKRYFLANITDVVFILDGNTDICSLNNGGCDQICYNKCGREVECACGTGYKLTYDKKTCLGKEY